LQVYSEWHVEANNLQQSFFSIFSVIPTHNHCWQIQFFLVYVIVSVNGFSGVHRRGQTAFFHIPATVYGHTVTYMQNGFNLLINLG